MVKSILAMPPPKKAEAKKAVTPVTIEDVKPKAPPIEPKEEDRIDFVNVKDLIKGMEGKKEKPDYQKETNGFHKNGHDTDEIEKCEEEREKVLEKAESNDSTELTLSRSNSYINGVPVQAPKPLPRSSISEPGSGDDHEAPKPKPRTTAVPISGYKVLNGLEFCFL